MTTFQRIRRLYHSTLTKHSYRTSFLQNLLKREKYNKVSKLYSILESVKCYGEKPGLKRAKKCRRRAWRFNRVVKENLSSRVEVWLEKQWRQRGRDSKKSQTLADHRRAMYLTMTEKESHLRREVTRSNVFYQDHSGCWVLKTLGEQKS